MHPQQDGEMSAGAHLTFSFSFDPDRIVLGHSLNIQGGSSRSVESFWKHHYLHMQRFVSVVTPNPFKLTVKTDHHRYIRRGESSVYFWETH